MATKKTTAPLFRGATKPAMIMGVPLTAFGYLFLPFFLGVGASIVVGRIGYLLFLIPIIGIPILREITKQDDQYLRLLTLTLNDKMSLFNNKANKDGYYVIPAKSIRNKGLIE